MTTAIAPLTWPLHRLGEALEALASHAGLLAPQDQTSDTLALPAGVASSTLDELDRWLAWAAGRLGLETESVDCAVPETVAMLCSAGPALLHLHLPDLPTPERHLRSPPGLHRQHHATHDGTGDADAAAETPHPDAAGRRIVLLLGQARRWPGQAQAVTVIGPDLRLHRCPVAALRAALCAAHEQPLQPEISRLLASAGVPSRRRPAVHQALLHQRLASQRTAGCWILRQPASTSAWRQLRQARLPQLLGALLLVFAAVYALEIGGWQLIGEAALDGRLDPGWLAAWALLLLSLVPLRALSAWLDGRLALGAGLLLKRRLLAGALRLDLDRVRHLGAGQVLGRVMESQALEGLALSGAVAVVVAGLELAFAGAILAAGAAAGLHLGLLAVWLALTGMLAARHGQRLARWTQLRLDMGQALIERMVGHRTVLAQDRPARRAAADDRSLQAYLVASQRMDAATVPIVAGLPGGWLLAALAALGPALAAGSATPGRLAISLGGILFAHRALGGITGGLSALARAGLAWGRVAEIFRAGAQAPSSAPFVSRAQLSAGRRPVASAAVAAAAGSGKTATTTASTTAATTALAGVAAPLVDAGHLVFRYRADRPPVLQGADLQIQPGERLLLAGPSGGGKSTLAALLVGLRQPNAGLLLLGGLDHHTLGDAWHQLATEAPQFHENHVFSGTLGFNLLMGRQWPATPAQLQEARSLCDELGLGPLIARMPAGLGQTVGETGWQLSHGERSRLFLARALLQDAPLTVLDESFAALDPATLQRCLDCALRRARTLVVIAHP